MYLSLFLFLDCTHLGSALKAGTEVASKLVAMMNAARSASRLYSPFTNAMNVLFARRHGADSSNQHEQGQINPVTISPKKNTKQDERMPYAKIFPDCTHLGSALKAGKEVASKL